MPKYKITIHYEKIVNAEDEEMAEYEFVKYLESQPQLEPLDILLEDMKIEKIGE